MNARLRTFLVLLSMHYHRLAPAATGFLLQAQYQRASGHRRPVRPGSIRPKTSVSMSADIPYPVRKLTFGLENKAHLKAIVDTHPNAVFVDVRNEDEIEAAKFNQQPFIRGSYLLRESLDCSRVRRDLPDTDVPIVVFCAKGGRAMVACKALRGIGYSNVFNAGGFQDLDFLGVE